MAATCMAVCKGSRKKIRGIFISSCHLPVAVECDIVILSEPGPIPQAPVGQFCRHNLSPRGDGNWWNPTQKLPLPDTTYPREGTETSVGRRMRVCGIDTTYPREGTETLGLHAGGCRLETQLIPARGRKLVCRAIRLVVGLDTTYPREGTETCKVANRVWLDFDTTYPREGTETYLSS